MTIKLWGIRGSIPTTGPEMAYYGGNTSCVDVKEEGWHLVFDGGSGIQRLSVSSTLDTKRIDILLTHLHLDHIQGLGFFRPLFDQTKEVHIWGPSGSSRTLHSRLSRYLSPPLFPVLIRDLPCKLVLHEVGNSIFEIGPFTLQSAYIIHPAPTVGYRLTYRNVVFTYIPDHEPALGRHGMIPDNKWVSGFDLAAGADILLHDAQYTSAEYEFKKGWGHSSIEDAGKFAAVTGVKHILYSHHDPFRSDEQLNEIFKTFLGSTNYKFKQELGREGMEMML